MARSRVLACRAPRLLGSGRFEQRTFRQGLVALVHCALAGSIVGLTLASRSVPIITSLTDQVRVVRWILVATTFGAIPHAA